MQNIDHQNSNYLETLKKNTIVLLFFALVATYNSLIKARISQ